jgi:hypothetical protein
MGCGDCEEPEGRMTALAGHHGTDTRYNYPLKEQEETTSPSSASTLPATLLPS